MSNAGIVVWLTGLPASGKTTLGRALLPLLADRGFRALLVDSDDFRPVLIPEPTYSSAERDRFYEFLGFLASWLAGQGIDTVVAATAHRRLYREGVRRRVTCFAEVYVVCPAEVCRTRDPKGIYARAAQGNATRVPGLGVPYEAPEAPEATVDTTEFEPHEAAGVVMAQLDPWLRTCAQPASSLAHPTKQSLEP